MSRSSSEDPIRADSASSGDPKRLETGATVQLAERLDFAATRELYERLAQLRGAAVHVDGAAVALCGALAAQVLLASQRAWEAAGHAWTLTASPALRDDLNRLGLQGAFPNSAEVE
jgi:chemotaxis protein CheX